MDAVADSPGVRVVVSHRSALLRAATVRLLVEAGFDVVGQAGDGGDLLRKVRAHRPDVAVIDVRMQPNRLDEGLDAARAIRRELPDVSVLVLSQHAEECYADALLEHGAEGVGYLVKDRVPDVATFTNAVREVAEGGSVLDPEVVVEMLARRRRNGVLEALSRRDRDVLAQIAEGASNRAIARRMFLSERAVERHVTAIFNALGIARCKDVHRRVLAVLAHLSAA
jgi:DNA-binding NarL/FixJ family response regulator